MSDDPDFVDAYLQQVRDRFTAEELVEVLGLDVEDIINAFYDQILDKKIEFR